VFHLVPLHRVLRGFLPQLAKFSVVGALSTLVDVGGFNVLRFAGGHGALYGHPLTAKVASASVATVLSWLGNRYWTFRRTRRPAAHHEFILFVTVSMLGTGIALACLAFSHYLLGLTTPLADNIAANVVGLFLATSFRFWTYRVHVFTQDDREPVAA
jgi:putative flippase GtrA